MSQKTRKDILLSAIQGFGLGAIVSVIVLTSVLMRGEEVVFKGGKAEWWHIAGLCASVSGVLAILLAGRSTSITVAFLLTGVPAGSLLAGLIFWFTDGEIGIFL